MNTANTKPFYLYPDEIEFPPANLALEEPNGLLAIGGQLSPQSLFNAYRNGLFPWYGPEEPILWWTPNPRSVIFVDNFHCSKSLNKLIRQKKYQTTIDKAFDAVISSCRQIYRPGQNGEWLSAEMVAAYRHLHHQHGLAHSVECWDGERLIGGLYGIAIGKVFFGESMFSYQANASKLAMAHLVEQLNNWGYALIDCQVESEHLNSLGAVNIPRKQFIDLLNSYCEQQSSSSPWPAKLEYSTDY